MQKLFLLAFAMLVTLNSASLAREVKVKSYTKKDGTVVAGYTKTVKDKDSDSDTVKVKAYTKKDGTKVEGYTRKKAK